MEKNSIKFLKISLIAVFLSVCAISCRYEDEPEPDIYVWFLNGSDEICYFFAYDYDDDTILTVDKVSNDFKTQLHPVRIRSGLMLRKVDDNWKNNMQVIVIKKSTYDRYTKEELAAGNIYDKYYCLSPDEIKAIDYQIIYYGE